MFARSESYPNNLDPVKTKSHSKCLCLPTRNVHIWDVDSQKLVYKLPGHLGSVNDVDFHRLLILISIDYIKFYITIFAFSVEPIILSVGSDKNIYLGEFEP